ncbi:Cathepsin L-like proteinase, partial [Orchesella cincta]
AEFYLDVDDILNSDFHLFPNTTVVHQVDFVHSTLEHFIRLLSDDDLLESAYTNFKIKFGEKRTLPTYNHFNSRIHVFKNNLIEIFHHNLRARMMMFSTYEMGVNQFADMTLEEFKKEKLGLIIPEDFSQPAKNLSIDSRSLPIKFDWSDHGVITPVKEQKECNACVMFAIAASLEAIYAIRKNKAVVDLSEQHLLDCASKENGYSNNGGCEGNLYQETFQFAMDYGLVSEHQYPYIGKQTECKSGFQPITKLKSYERVNSRPEDLKAAVLNTGPVPIGIFVYKEFMFYKEGVFDGCIHENNIGGHAMVVVGYNDEERVKNYRLKNQWGDTWGEKGFARFISTDSRCGMEKLAFGLRI